MIEIEYDFIAGVQLGLEFVNFEENGMEMNGMILNLLIIKFLIVW